jgi:DNA-binding IclR family transcriptional regulator
MKAVEKSLRVLDQFTFARPEWGLLELSEVSQLPVSTLHRIVTVLKRNGLLTQDRDTKKYRLGYGAIELGRRAAASLPIRRVADSVMHRLAEATGETIVLTVLNDVRDRAVCIERIESRFDLRLHLDVGTMSYLHAGASSKVLLAYLPDREVDQLAERVGFPKLAPGTIDTLDALKVELHKIRERGYAFSREETDVGAWGVAAPVLDHGSSVIAGVGIASPTSRYSKQVEERFTALVREGALDVTRGLGLVDAA